MPLIPRVPRTRCRACQPPSRLGVSAAGRGHQPPERRHQHRLAAAQLALDALGVLLHGACARVRRPQREELLLEAQPLGLLEVVRVAVAQGVDGAQRLPGHVLAVAPVPAQDGLQVGQQPRLAGLRLVGRVAADGKQCGAGHLRDALVVVRQRRAQQRLEHRHGAQPARRRLVGHVAVAQRPQRAAAQRGGVPVGHDDGHAEQLHQVAHQAQPARLGAVAGVEGAYAHQRVGGVARGVGGLRAVALQHLLEERQQPRLARRGLRLLLGAHHRGDGGRHGGRARGRVEPVALERLAQVREEAEPERLRAVRRVRVAQRPDGARAALRHAHVAPERDQRRLQLRQRARGARGVLGGAVEAERPKRARGLGGDARAGARVRAQHVDQLHRQPQPKRQRAVALHGAADGAHRRRALLRHAGERLGVRRQHRLHLRQQPQPPGLLRDAHIVLVGAQQRDGPRRLLHRRRLRLHALVGAAHAAGGRRLPQQQLQVRQQVRRLRHQRLAPRRAQQRPQHPARALQHRGPPAVRVQQRAQRVEQPQVARLVDQRRHGGQVPERRARLLGHAAVRGAVLPQHVRQLRHEPCVASGLLHLVAVAREVHHRARGVLRHAGVGAAVAHQRALQQLQQPGARCLAVVQPHLRRLRVHDAARV
mmetsp:Transcript_570/g.1370  ORF Transcript_570/g.1370 Transcript_570/m.1370 type:complete len:649 (+) Transcript_570:73-2019(+)